MANGHTIESVGLVPADLILNEDRFTYRIADKLIPFNSHLVTVIVSLAKTGGSRYLPRL